MRLHLEQLALLKPVAWHKAVAGRKALVVYLPVTGPKTVTGFKVKT